jgi:hypothetical protein
MSEVKFGKPYMVHITIDPTRPSFGKEYECYPVIGTQFEGLEVYKSAKRWRCHVRYGRHAFALNCGSKSKRDAAKRGIGELWRWGIANQEDLLKQCQDEADKELRLIGVEA